MNFFGSWFSQRTGREMTQAQNLPYDREALANSFFTNRLWSTAASPLHVYAGMGSSGSAIYVYVGRK